MSSAAEPQNETRAFKACLGGQVAVFEHLLSTVETSGPGRAVAATEKVPVAVRSVISGCGICTAHFIELSPEKFGGRSCETEITFQLPDRPCSSLADDLGRSAVEEIRLAAEKHATRTFSSTLQVRSMGDERGKAAAADLQVEIARYLERRCLREPPHR